jgi:hypothetical protein
MAVLARPVVGLHPDNVTGFVQTETNHALACAIAGRNRQGARIEDAPMELVI